MTTKRRVLFLCTHNSSRSIMAEALVNYYLGDRWEAFSAGTEPGGVNPFAIAALRELGIEIPQAKSKKMDIFFCRHFDRVYTLCDEANEACPNWMGVARREHIGFPDPSAVIGSDKDKLAAFREVRDQIRKQFIPLLSKPEISSG